MDWLNRTKSALEYIEEHLCDEIDKEELAAIAGCSEFHFQRVFSFIAGVSLGEYIRRRRLTRAGFEVQSTNIKVVDLALKYQYESPEAFTRAFHKQHGTTPSKARIEGISLKAYPRISINISIKGDVAMDYRIETKEGFSVYGIEGIFSYDRQDESNLVPKFWQECISNGQLDQLVKTTKWQSMTGLLAVNGLQRYKKTEGKTFPYMLFAYVTKNSKVDGYPVIDIPASTWAIFKSRECDNSEITQVTIELNKRIYTEWIPMARYDIVEGFEQELYYKNQETEKNHCEVWVRVRVK